MSPEKKGGYGKFRIPTVMVLKIKLLLPSGDRKRPAVQVRPEVISPYQEVQAAGRYFFAINPGLTGQNVQNFLKTLTQPGRVVKSRVYLFDR